MSPTKEQYPMLEQIKAIEEQSHLCGEFLEFLQTKYVMFDKMQPRDTPYYIGAGDYIHTERLLAEFFNIDLKQAEEERQAILQSLQTKKGTII